MQVGDLVRYSLRPNHAIGLIVKADKDIHTRYQPFYQVFWPSAGSFTWVTKRDLEIINESG